MRRLVLLLLLCAVRLEAQSHPVFTTPAQEAVFAQMKADYDANPTSPSTYGGRWYKYIKTSADNSQDFIGYARAWMYHVTGTASYAASAYAEQAVWLAKEEVEPRMCRTESSHTWPQRVLIYDWIYPALSAGERTTFLNKLNVTAALCANDEDLQLPAMEDPDQTLGDYFGVAMLHRATTSYNATINTYWGDSARQIGGYTSTAADFTTRRNAVRYLVENYGEGGEEGDGSSYNVLPMALAMLGYWALEVVGETSNFPEIAELLEDENLPHAYMSSGSPGFGMYHQWGDEEQTNPRGPNSIYRMAKAQCIAGLTQTNTAFQDWWLDFLDSYGGFAPQVSSNRLAANGANPWIWCAPVWNPYAARGDHSIEPLSHFAEGMGIATFRTDWSSNADWFTSTMTPQRPASVSPAHAGAHFVDFQLWQNGGWVLTHPIAYGGPTVDGRYTGTMMFPVGPLWLSWMPEYRGARTVKDDGDYAYVAGTQGGSMFWDGYYQMPPTTLMEDSRSIVWLKNADIVVSFSRTNINDPRPCGTNYSTTLRTYCNSGVPLKRATVHSPVLPTVTSNHIDWTQTATTHNAAATIRVTNLLPTDSGLTVTNEATEWPTLVNRGTFQTTEAKYHVNIIPGADRKWDTFLTVYDVNAATPRAVTLVQDATNDADAVFIATTGQNYLLVFNAIQGPDVPQPTYVNGRGYVLVEPHKSQTEAILDTVRLRSVGYSLTFTVSANNTKALLFDLDPAEGWLYAINAGGTQPLTVSSEGVGEIDFATTGSVTLAVTPGGDLPISITTGSLSDGVVGDDCSDMGSFEATGGDGGPYTWSETGTQPTGCTLGADGTWSGTFAADGTFTFTVIAADAAPPTASREYTVTVADTPIIITVDLDDGVVGQAYSDNCLGSGGTEPYTFEIGDGEVPHDEDGELPPGLTINEANCAITGTPTTTGLYNFDITLTDDNDAEVTRGYSVNISELVSGIIEVFIEQQGFRAIVHYRLLHLPLDSSCTVDLYDETTPGPPPFTPIDSETQATGLARRFALFTNLDPDHIYAVVVQCTTTAASGPHYFTMPDAPGIGEKVVPISMPPAPAIIPTASRVTLEWDYNGSMVGAETVEETDCLLGCQLDVTFPQQNVYYYRLKRQNPVGTDTLDDNLARYYPMDETSDDRDDKLNPGDTNSWDVQAGAPALGTGKHRGAVSISTAARLTLATATLFPSTTFTLAFWVNPTTLSDVAPPGVPILAAESGATTGLDILKAFGSNNIVYTIYPGGQSATVTGNPLSTGSMHLVVVWFDDTSNIGGIQIDNGTAVTFTGGSFARTSGTMGLPWSSGITGMTGLVGELMLFDDVILTADQRTALYNSGRGVFHPFVDTLATSAVQPLVVK